MFMYVPENLARVLKLPLEEVRTILDELCELRVVRKEELQLEEKIGTWLVDRYRTSDPRKFCSQLSR